jgi:nitrile hydratase accessory protein
MFSEPWQAQVLAMADLLVQSGTISKSDWAETLGTEIRAATVAGRPDDTETYFSAALSALEHLLVTGQSVSSQELTVRRDEWEHAYERTPHGQPVVLSQS